MLKDKVALVTGAASGIGRCVALTWAREGARVVLADLNEEQGQETAALVRELGAEALYLRADAGKRVSLSTLAITCATRSSTELAKLSFSNTTGTVSSELAAPGSDKAASRDESGASRLKLTHNMPIGCCCRLRIVMEADLSSCP